MALTLRYTEPIWRLYDLDLQITVRLSSLNVPYITVIFLIFEVNFMYTYQALLQIFLLRSASSKILLTTTSSLFHHVYIFICINVLVAITSVLAWNMYSAKLFLLFFVPSTDILFSVKNKLYLCRRAVHCFHCSY